MKKPNDRFKLVDQVFYLLTPDGFHGSKLGANAEKYLDVPVTARNLRSATRIVELTM